jgi:hypothetical protein
MRSYVRLLDYASIEQRIVQGSISHCTVQKIHMLHPTMVEDADFLYEV